jgi:hypothetical protein
MRWEGLKSSVRRAAPSDVRIAKARKLHEPKTAQRGTSALRTLAFPDQHSIQRDRGDHHPGRAPWSRDRSMSMHNSCQTGAVGFPILPAFSHTLAHQGHKQGAQRVQHARKNLSR